MQDDTSEKNMEILARLAELDEMVTATRVAMEIRQAGEKLGSRFIKTVSAWEIPFKSKIFMSISNFQERRIILLYTEFFVREQELTGR